MYRTTGRMDLSNCNIGYIKTCNNNNFGMKSAYFFNDLILFSLLLILMNKQVMQICFFKGVYSFMCTMKKTHSNI